jgi:hypothetical protein
MRLPMTTTVFFCFAGLAAALGASLDARAESRSAVLKRIRNSQEVFHELMHTPRQSHPSRTTRVCKMYSHHPG